MLSRALPSRQPATAVTPGRLHRGRLHRGGYIMAGYIGGGYIGARPTSSAVSRASLSLAYNGGIHPPEARSEIHCIGEGNERRDPTRRGRYPNPSKSRVRRGFRPHLGDAPRASGRAVLVCAGLLRRKHLFYFILGRGLDWWSASRTQRAAASPRAQAETSILFYSILGFDESILI